MPDRQSGRCPDPAGRRRGAGESRDDAGAAGRAPSPRHPPAPPPSSRMPEGCHGWAGCRARHRSMGPRGDPPPTPACCGGFQQDPSIWWAAYVVFKMRPLHRGDDTWPQRKRSGVQGALYGLAQVNLAAPLASKTGLSTLSPQEPSIGPKAQGASHAAVRVRTQHRAHSQQHTANCVPHTRTRHASWSGSRAKHRLVGRVGGTPQAAGHRSNTTGPPMQHRLKKRAVQAPPRGVRTQEARQGTNRPARAATLGHEPPAQSPRGERDGD